MLFSIYESISYHLEYLVLLLKTPIVLAAWELGFTSAPFLIVQELADAYGLYCVLILMLAATLLKLNAVLSVYRRTGSSSSSMFSNYLNSKIFTPVSSSFRSLKLQLSSSVASLAANFKNRK